MTATAIAFEGVTKHYRGAQYGMLREDVAALAARLLRRPRPPRDVVRALDGISLDIPAGQSTALIGLNGAGKTTALKLATRIAYPTEGQLRVRGRVGALIEVGSGMHPELTGRENVELYGRILGLSRRDVRARFDRIVEFADVGVALERPVKQFSSGMQLRLGFSLAAHLEPDVLLVDEAIAVGDAGFQYRCVERMSELVREGRTLVFVSHDMSAVEHLCERAILLRDGRVAADGRARDVVRDYLLSVHAERLGAQESGAVSGSGSLEIVRVAVLDRRGEEVETVRSGEPLTARFHYHASAAVTRPIFSVGLSDGRRGCFTLASMLIDGEAPEQLAGDGFVDCAFHELPLRPGTYEIWMSVRGPEGYGDIVDWQRVRRFFVLDDGAEAASGAVTHSLADAPVKLPYSWTVVAGDDARR